MVEIPRAAFEMQESIARSKDLIRRLERGQQFLSEAVKTRSVNKAEEAVKLFNRLANELNDELEDALFMHQMLATGKTTLINRKGKAVNATVFNPKETKVVELFELKSMQRLKEVFGEENIIDFETEA